MYVVLYQPEIAPNTGNIARTCAAVGCPLHLIAPLGFQLDDRRLKRAGLDYWPQVELITHDSWADFVQNRPPGSLYALSARATTPCWAADFTLPVGLLFGPETRGLPETILRDYPNLVVPMGRGVRSLNLAVTVGIVLYEALRQQTH
ncbi:tRNA (cytidine(34)-2'-O)-methyltransferase [Candidatus Cyanaurora vandensis]|uniref:tRNA (cytidine(34)-2'-O)-methyltransferase n=1 Tax=Candidatus Cyanaurora vandensis TaxID=2714958 RepID=UPI00257D771D|nr:tRNA (cytidine(34)-2'-O)-methyltransferase [Candidatus Cyanaurora vandensis]